MSAVKIKVLASLILLSLWAPKTVLAQAGELCDNKGERTFNDLDCSKYYFCSSQIDGTIRWTETPCQESTIFPENGTTCIHGDPTECFRRCNATAIDESIGEEEGRSAGVTEETTTTTTENPDPLSLVGTIKRKTYYIAHERKDWWDSKKLCEKFGMRLAMVKNSDELSFLHQNWADKIGISYAWIAARDRLTIHQFAWDYDNQPVKDFGNFRNEYEFQGCCYLYYSAFGGTKCSNKWSTLCESK